MYLLHATRTGSFTHQFSIAATVHTRTGRFTHHFSTCHQNRYIHTSFQYMPPLQVDLYFFVCCSTLISHWSRLICVIALHVFSIRTSTLASLHCMSSHQNMSTCKHYYNTQPMLVNVCDHTSVFTQTLSHSVPCHSVLTLVFCSYHQKPPAGDGL